MPDRRLIDAKLAMFRLTPTQEQEDRAKHACRAAMAHRPGGQDRRSVR